MSTARFPATADLLRHVGAAALIATATATASANTIAITEFLNDAPSTDGDKEWVELYNYGTQAVNLNNWNLRDNFLSSSFTLPDVTIASGDYLVLVESKAFFESNWFGPGLTDSRVVEGFGFTMNNGNDGLTLANAGGQTVWTLGYSDDESPEGFDGRGRATFLAVNDFSTKDFGEPFKSDPAEIGEGNPTVPGRELIVRNGLDLVTATTLGFEGNHFTTDAFAYTAADNSVGSPLRGQYSVAIPEPASLALIGLGGLLIASRRRADR